MFRFPGKVILFFLLIQHGRSKSSYTYQSYQRSITCVSQYAPSQPRSLQEIQDTIRLAVNRNLTVKPLGNLYSISDALCTTGIPLNLTHIRHFAYHRKTQTCTVGAGVELHDLFEKLFTYHRSLSGVPYFSGVTVGGAVAMGSELSGKLVSLTIVDGRGRVRHIDRDHPHFSAFQVNLGLLGVIYEVTLKTEPQYKLHLQNMAVRDTLLQDNSLIDYFEKHDFFQFSWFPTNQQLILSLGKRVSLNYSGNCETRYVQNLASFTRSAVSTAIEAVQLAKDDLGMWNLQSLEMQRLHTPVLGREPIFVQHADHSTSCLQNPVGYALRMVSNQCSECYWQDENGIQEHVSSVAIPLEKLLPALRKLGEVFEKQLTQFPLRGILVRFVEGVEAPLGLGSGTWAVVEWTSVSRWDKTQPQLGIAGYQMMTQVLLDEFGGKPLWSRNPFHFTNPQRIRKAFPHLSSFIVAMNAHDARGTFMNHFGERIKNGREFYTVSSHLAENCALNDLCFCQKNKDCGAEGLLDYLCSTVADFDSSHHVCLPGLVEWAKEINSKSVINLLAAAK